MAEFAGVAFRCLYQQKNKIACYSVVDNLPSGVAGGVINCRVDRVCFPNAVVLHLRCICHNLPFLVGVYAVQSVKTTPRGLITKDAQFRVDNAD